MDIQGLNPRTPPKRFQIHREGSLEQFAIDESTKPKSFVSNSECSESSSTSFSENVDSLLTESSIHATLSPIAKRYNHKSREIEISRQDSICEPRYGCPEWKLMEGAQSSLNDTVGVLLSRIRYLEDLVEEYRRELKDVTDLKISLRVKEIECLDLVICKYLSSQTSLLTPLDLHRLPPSAN